MTLFRPEVALRKPTNPERLPPSAAAAVWGYFE
jgi:hypothetical protein